MEEILLAGGIGALAVYCVFGLLPKGAARQMVPRHPREIVGDAAGAWAAALGGVLTRFGLNRAGVVTKMADCLADAAPLDLADESARLGLLAGLEMGCVLTGFIVSGSFMGAVVGAVLPLACLRVRVALCERNRACEVESAMPEAFGALAIALGSGHSLSQAMRFVGSHAREPVRTEFMRVSFSIDCGIPAVEALDALLARMPAPGLELVALALKVSQRTGAPLNDLLREASQLVGTRVELKRQLDVKTAQARMSARLVAAMPVMMAVVLTLISDDFRRGATRPVGAACLALALALNAVAWGIIGRIMKVEL